ncbi:hypothetical protein FBU59_003810 [Linderina macrospora]|uniref:Uncharacterized protein n=1 Tax=Linderina macrospora TaxID=4868 RepID=A0ACC1J784_9FUNG|nr:hypothetical protein FBU59_003810 [Linderina macrospora]
MSTTYTLRYFPSIGISETIRTLLNLVGAQWTEEHPEWPASKDQQPFGRLPVLVETTANGETFELSESPAIERYILRTFGLSPTNAKEAARQEQLREQVTDIQQAMMYYHFADEGEYKEKLRQRVVDLVATAVRVFPKMLKENGDNGHFFGDKTTYADIAFYNLISLVRIKGEEKGEEAASSVAAFNVPEFEKLLAAVEAEPALQSHFATRQKVSNA